MGKTRTTIYGRGNEIEIKKRRDFRLAEDSVFTCGKEKEGTDRHEKEKRKSTRDFTITTLRWAPPRPPRRFFSITFAPQSLSCLDAPRTIALAAPPLDCSSFWCRLVSALTTLPVYSIRHFLSFWTMTTNNGHYVNDIFSHFPCPLNRLVVRWCTFSFSFSYRVLHVLTHFKFAPTSFTEKLFPISHDPSVLDFLHIWWKVR